MNPWKKEKMTPDEIARALTLEFFGPTGGTNPIFLSALRAAAAGDRDAAADKQLRDAVASRDEALRLAYIGDCRDPGQTWQARCRELEKELTETKARAEKAEADVQWMVEKAADQKLDGYRELGARAAEAENQRDAMARERNAAVERTKKVEAWWAEAVPAVLAALGGEDPNCVDPSTVTASELGLHASDVRRAWEAKLAAAEAKLAELEGAASGSVFAACAVLGCRKPTEWLVSLTHKSSGVDLELPLCGEHEPAVAPRAPVVGEEVPDA